MYNCQLFNPLLHYRFTCGSTLEMESSKCLLCQQLVTMPLTHGLNGIKMLGQAMINYTASTSILNGPFTNSV